MSADYLAAFLRPARLANPLVTTGSPLDAHPGALGQPNTAVLFGGPLDFNLFSGARVEAGLFLDHDKVFSLDAIFFYLFPSTLSFTASSDSAGSPLIARPFFSVAALEERSYLDSFQGVIAGNTAIDAKSQMGGFEVNARAHCYLGQHFHADGLVGVRFLTLVESLTIRDQLVPLVDNSLTFKAMAVNPPNQLADEDACKTFNSFFGPQIGARLSWQHDWFSLDAFGKVAIGATGQRVNINGTTTLITPTGNQTAVGGILALPPNMGNHHRTVFDVVPEFGLNVSVDVTRHVRVLLGYSALFWDQVVRPGQQFDHAVNPGLVPSDQTFGTVSGAIRPTYRFNQEFLWVHTFNMGLELHF